MAAIRNAALNLTQSETTTKLLTEAARLLEEMKDEINKSNPAYPTLLRSALAAMRAAALLALKALNYPDPASRKRLQSHATLLKDYADEILAVPGLVDMDSLKADTTAISTAPSRVVQTALKRRKEENKGHVEAYKDKIPYQTNSAYVKGIEDLTKTMKDLAGQLTAAKKADAEAWDTLGEVNAASDDDGEEHEVEPAARRQNPRTRAHALVQLESDED